MCLGEWGMCHDHDAQRPVLETAHKTATAFIVYSRGGFAIHQFEHTLSNFIDRFNKISILSRYPVAIFVSST
jgi:hypothetical protein